MSYRNSLLKRTLSALIVTVALASCAAVSGRETTGAYVDDATVTTKVKAQIFNDPSLRVLQINVETMQDVVQLSGFVDSTQTKARAGEIARGVEGVRSVKNDLVVR